MTENFKILEIFAGSHSYGTNIESSDIDKRGIFVLPEKTIITKYNYIDEVEGKTPDDFRYYELSKYISLLSKQNPNIMEILWTDSPHLISISKAGEYLKSKREHLLSKEVSKTYVEYAVSQLKRIKGHNKMIMKPQSENPPLIKDFVKILYNFTDNKKYNTNVPSNEFVLYQQDKQTIVAFDIKKILELKPNFKPNDSLFLDNGALRLRDKTEFHELKTKNYKPDIILHFNETAYDEKLSLWKQYWSWVKNRNPNRSSLEYSYGYDTKHAMHVIRLLRSGYEILTENKVNVFRKDAEELLSIRHGKWSYEKLLDESNNLQEKIKNLQSNLPDSINLEFISNICYETYQIAWNESLTPKTKNKSYK